MKAMPKFLKDYLVSLTPRDQQAFLNWFESTRVVGAVENRIAEMIRNGGK